VTETGENSQEKETTNKPGMKLKWRKNRQ